MHTGIFVGLIALLMTGNVWSQTISPNETDAAKIMRAVEEREQGDRSKSVLNMEV